MRTPEPRPAKKRRVQIDDAPPPPKRNPALKPAVANVPDAPHVPDAAPAPAPARPPTFKIVAGSYEKLLYGLEASLVPTPDPAAARPWRIDLRPIFMFPAHASCVKAVAASPAGGKWLATGSADEIIKLWDLRRRKEVGGLVHHQGSITQLAFASRSHLLSASEDGTLCLFRARDWAVLRALRGHTGRVNAAAVHPSGKLALSVGRDRTLRMWDLLRGRGAASTKLPAEGEGVRWSPTGTRFAVQALARIDLFSTKMALQCTIAHPARVHDVRFVRAAAPGARELLLVAAEDKRVAVYALPGAADADAAAPRVVAALVGHANRVKAVDSIALAGALLACTVSSDGVIRVFDLGAVPAGADADADTEPLALEPVAAYDTHGSRLTCVTVADGEDGAAGGKRKRGDVQAEAEEAEEAEGDDASAHSDAD